MPAVVRVVDDPYRYMGRNRWWIKEFRAADG